MNAAQIRTIAIIGAGNMGHQVSTLCAMHGFETYVTDSSGEQLDRARKFVAEYLPGRVKKGRITQEECDRATSLIYFEPRLEDAVKNADVVIEAVFEQIELKIKIFKECERYCRQDTIFTTNASAIPSSEIAKALENPARICNMHFFNPALVMKCVEVMRGPHTADDTFEAVVELTKRLGKIPSKIEKELYGMVGTRITTAIMREAMWIYESGYAPYEDIDAICRNALGHPMGPFELADLTGIDLGYINSMARFQVTNNRKDLPWPIIVEKYFKGEYGRKSGKGFYEYPPKETN